MAEEEKEKKPISPMDVVKALNSSFKEESASAEDLILERAKKAGVLPGRQQHVASASQVGGKLNLDAALPKIPPIEINGYELVRTNVPQMDAITVLMFIMATEFSRDPRIKAILDQIQFRLPDIHGNLIYPRPEKETRKTKKRNAKPK